MARGDKFDVLGVTLEESSEETEGDDTSSSDRQDRSEGIDLDDRPTLNADLIGKDPHPGLEPGTLERETVFDPTANLPEGMSVDTVLASMTGLDGKSIKLGPNHHGVGNDAILGEHGLDANSPFNVSRDPFAATGGGAQPTWVGEGHKDPPPGMGGKYDEVSAPKDPKAPFAPKEPEKLKDFGDKKETTTFEDIVALPGKVVDAVNEIIAIPGKIVDGLGGGKKMDDGSGDEGMRLPTAQEVEDAMKSKGGGAVSRPVEGGSGGPQIDSNGPPPENPRYRGVTDPIDEVTTETGIPTTLPGGAPDAPVIHTINPESGVGQPKQTSNQGQGGQPPGTIVNDGGQAATAEFVETIPSDGITEVGSGNGIGSIQSVDTSGLDAPSDSLDLDDFAADGEMLDAEPEAGRDLFDSNDA